MRSMDGGRFRRNELIAVALVPSRRDQVLETFASSGQSCNKLNMTGSCGWSLTTYAPVPGSPTALELGFIHVTLHTVALPVTLIVVDAVLGPPNVGALVPALTTWLREDATSSLVTGSPDPVGESAFLLGLLPLRVGMYWLSTCPLIKGDPSWPDAMPNVAPLRLTSRPARCPSPTPTPRPSMSTAITTSSACPPTAPHRMSGPSVLERLSIAWMTNLTQGRGTRMHPPYPPFASFGVALFDSPRSDRRAVLLGM